MTHIGKHWRPAWFERRHRDGTYEALNAPQWPESIKLQGDLLGGDLGGLDAADWRFWRQWVLYGATVILAVGGAVVHNLP